jgi:hypothetical protein
LPKKRGLNVILSPHEVAYIVKLFFDDPEDQRKMVAFAIAESGANTNVIARSTSGANVGQRDHGTWQISGRWNGDKLVAAAENGLNWRDPFVNCWLAAQVWFEGGPIQWHVFQAEGIGSYAQYLPDADFALKYPVKPFLI